MDRRSKGWREVADLAQPDEVSGNPDSSPLVELEPRCNVCSLPKQPYPNAERVARLIQQGLLSLLEYARIKFLIDPEMETWAPADRVSYTSIRNHANRHLPVDQTLIRELVERRAQAAGQAVLDGAEPMLTSAALYELTMRRGFERLASGEAAPSIREALMAASLLDQLESGATEGSSLVELRAQLHIIVEVIQQRVGRKAWSEIVSDLRAIDGVELALPEPKVKPRRGRRQPDG